MVSCRVDIARRPLRRAAAASVTSRSRAPGIFLVKSGGDLRRLTSGEPSVIAVGSPTLWEERRCRGRRREFRFFFAVYVTAGVGVWVVMCVCVWGGRWFRGVNRETGGAV